MRQITNLNICLWYLFVDIALVGLLKEPKILVMRFRGQ
jgi:hypothetical protein